MPRQSSLTPQFVTFIPESIEHGKLYVSMEYATATHLCCCGCGNRVVTPLSPNDWKLNFDGRSISLYPSIGNWSFPCQSHYVIEANEVRWAGRMTKSEIALVREKDRLTKVRYFKNPADDAKAQPPSPNQLSETARENTNALISGLRRFAELWRKKDT